MPGDDLEHARGRWLHRGRQRPGFAHTPGPGQESVWDYPRPPALEENYRPVEVLAGERLIARSLCGFRVLETAGAPTYYLPPEAVDLDALQPVSGHTFCEWNGQADYWALAQDGDAPPVAWTYPEPFDAFLPIAGHFAFYPGRVDCWLAGEKVRRQPGGFYGGWVTDAIVGPFKGEPGTEDW